MAFWQYNQDLSLIFEANTQLELAKNSQLGPSYEIDSLYLLFQVLSGFALS